MDRDSPKQKALQWNTYDKLHIAHVNNNKVALSVEFNWTLSNFKSNKFQDS